MPTPPNKDWEAFENRQPIVDPKGFPFFVIGKVQTNSGSIQPVLKKKEPQGINPADLLLVLTLEDGGGGTDDINYRDARYDEYVEKGQYNTVTILFEDSIVANLKVEILN